MPVGGKLDATPSTYGDGGTWSFLESHVTLTLTDYPPNTASVFFYVRVDGRADGIGQDLVLFVLRGGTIQALRLEGAGAAVRRLVPLLRLNVEHSAAAVAGIVTPTPALTQPPRSNR